MRTNADIVFIDLDGVLVDLVGGIADLFGADADLVRHRCQSWGGIHRALSYALGVEVSSEELWATVASEGEDFWAGLPWCPGGKKTLEALTQPLRYIDSSLWDLVDPGAPSFEFHVLTSPGFIPASAAGKVQWVAHHMGVVEAREMVLTANKHLLAGPRRILIDDAPHNCDAWQKMGGQALIRPQPWNHEEETFDSFLKSCARISMDEAKAPLVTI